MITTKMKYLIKLANIILTVFTVVFQSCDNNEYQDEPVAKAAIKSCNICCSTSEDIESRAVTKHQWEEGDKLFVKFGPIVGAGSYTNVGIATYSNGNWNMELKGASSSLPITMEEKCEIIFVKGTYSINENKIIFTDNCSIYEGCSLHSNCIGEAQYTMTASGDLYISATLSPKLSRFRIRGEKNATYEIKGFSWISKDYDMWWGNEVDLSSITESKTLICNIEENGVYYTPYVYGLPKGIAPIKIKVGSKVFARDNPFKGGKSYEIAAPTVSNHEDWEMEDYINKRFSISKTAITGMVDLWNYDLVDLKAELKSKLGISADGYLSCATSNSSEESRVLFTFDSEGSTHGSLGSGYMIESTNDEMLFDTYGYNNDYNPSFKAYVWSGVTSYDQTFHLYAYGVNAYVNSTSYIYLSNF